MEPQDKDKPKQPISIVYANAKQTITSALRNVLRAYPLPLFMVESIFADILLEFRKESTMELSADMEDYKEKLKEYYEQRKQELEDMHEAEKDELIRQFEENGIIEINKQYDRETTETTGEV